MATIIYIDALYAALRAQGVGLTYTVVEDAVNAAESVEAIYR